MTDTASALHPAGTVPTPRGPRGLWGALAGVVAPAVVARALPTTDPSVIVAPASMFDYDPSLATAVEGWGELPLRG